jgi:hypothetical protein
VRAALILPSQFPNGPKLATQGVDTTYYPATEPGQPLLTAAALDERRKFWRVGIMYDPSWIIPRDAFDAKTVEAKTAWGTRFAGILSDTLTQLASPSFFSSTGAPKQCFVMADIEYQSNAFMVAFLKEWRRLRTARFTIWSPESMQGGWMEPDLVQLINADQNLMVAKQNYTGAMKKIDGSVSALNLIKQGIRWERITSMHSLRDGPTNPLDDWWDGIALLENWEQLP